MTDGKDVVVQLWMLATRETALPNIPRADGLICRVPSQAHHCVGISQLSGPLVAFDNCAGDFRGFVA